ncbi:restriction endonuclease subunit S [Flavobacterium filum]|uniref:restriction endonuclease subunit S n=1 Tax=Flavobacterium filum TaxID=370974 RepID=UPI0023F5931E|nr:restriction endonuclease subunit S [Flavobacterium filum]
MKETQSISNSNQIKKLGEVCTYSKGKKPAVLKEAKTKECSVPYINIKAFEKGIISEYTNGEKCNICEDDDLLMVWDGARCGLIGKAKKGAVGSTLMKILPKENIHKEYLYHFISSKFWTLNTKPKGVGIPHIEPTLLWNFELVVPPIPEQQAIVSKIEELLSELENGKQQLLTAQQQLKVYRQSLLKWAFEGKLTNKNVKEGKLPKEWKIVKLSDLGAWKGGGTPSKQVNKYWENGSNLWVTSKDMKTGVIYDSINKITDEAILNSSANRIPKGAILFVMRSGILRHTFPVAIAGKDLTVNQDLQTLSPNNLATSEFIYWFIKAFNNDIRQKCSKDGTTVESIESSSLKNYPFILPPLPEQQLIVSELESKLTVCDKIEETISQSLQQAETLKQSILKKAFEGKLVNTENMTVINELR